MLRAVYISHLHSDHVYDLLPIGKKILAETTVLDQSTGTAHLESAPRIPLYVPAGAAEKLEALSAVFPMITQPWMNTPFELAFKLIEYAPGDRFEVEGISVQLELLRHVEDCCGIRMEADGRSLVYSGDTGVTDALVGLAANAGTLLAESTLDQTDAGRHGHLSAGDSGRAAAAAGVGQLILTHFTTHEEHRLEWHKSQAAAVYSGPVGIARPDHTFTVLPTQKAPTS